MSCQTFINDILRYWTDTFIDMAMRYIQMHNSLRWGIRDTEKHSKHNQRSGILVFIIITNIKPSHYIHKFNWNILAKKWKKGPILKEMKKQNIENPKICFLLKYASLILFVMANAIFQLSSLSSMLKDILGEFITFSG